jgi:hypothetical protein
MEPPFNFALAQLAFGKAMNKVRTAFANREFQRVVANIERTLIFDADNLADLDYVARLSGERLHKLIQELGMTRRNSIFAPRGDAILALLEVWTETCEMAGKALTYLEASQLALGNVVPLTPMLSDEAMAERVQLADNLRRRAEEAYLPCFRRHYTILARYVEHLLDAPGTSFYPGRPPKRKGPSPMWYFSKRRCTGERPLPWEPAERPWAAVEEEEGWDEGGVWALHQGVIDHWNNGTENQRAETPKRPTRSPTDSPLTTPPPEEEDEEPSEVSEQFEPRGPRFQVTGLRMIVREPVEVE